jgi:hypothetical protein
MTSFIYKCIQDVTKKDYDLITDSFQKSIDWWSWEKSLGSRPYIFVVKLGKPSVYRTLNSKETVKEWADYLMINKYNRVEKRLMKEMYEQEYDGMETVEPKDTTERYEDVRFRDEMPDLMGKVFGGSEKLKEDLNFHGAFEKMSKDEQDQIINPKHYKMIPAEAYSRFPEGLEYMDLMEYILDHHNGVQSHLLGQVFKYACRLGKKDAKLQDAKKIAWYANRLVEVIENEG